jgi:hypothetical protein
VTKADSAARTLALLKKIGKTPYQFQAESVDRVLAAAADSERLLLQAPTGAGKTLIAYLTAARLAKRQGPQFRGLVVVPSRPLLRQHVVDAGWLRGAVGVPIHLLTPDQPLRLWSAVLGGPGLICTTPHALGSRLARLGGLAAFPLFDIAQFDEIDLFLTVDLAERQDIWAVLDQVMQTGTPAVGYTGTLLSESQSREWAKRGFAPWEPNLPDDWLPFTRVQFQAVRNSGVIDADQEISRKLKDANRRYGDAGGNPRSWYQIKLDAKTAGPLALEARAILTLHAERLKLFEGHDDRTGKLTSLVAAIKKKSGLVLTRYIFSAIAAANMLNSKGIHALQADGQMRAVEADRYARQFRAGDAPVLVITRDLGGRGLDFPSAETAVLISPRSNYQAVAQELARIRSRRGAPKTATVLYYEDTTESSKASRLARHLMRDQRFGSRDLFEVSGAPKPVAAEDPLERAHAVLEESISLDLSTVEFSNRAPPSAARR